MRSEDKQGGPVGKQGYKRNRGNSIASQIPKGKYTTATVATEAGVSVQTIHRWRREGVLPPSGNRGKPKKIGNIRVFIFTQADVDRAKLLAQGKEVLVDRLLVSG